MNEDPFVALVRELEEGPAPIYRDSRGDIRCGFCAERLLNGNGAPLTEHDPTCLYVRARRLIQRHDEVTRLAVGGYREER